VPQGSGRCAASTCPLGGKTINHTWQLLHKTSSQVPCPPSATGVELCDTAQHALVTAAVMQAPRSHNTRPVLSAPAAVCTHCCAMAAGCWQPHHVCPPQHSDHARTACDHQQALLQCVLSCSCPSTSGAVPPGCPVQPSEWVSTPTGYTTTHTPPTVLSLPYPLRNQLPTCRPMHSSKRGRAH
jgi:hypothetical protein